MSGIILFLAVQFAANTAFTNSKFPSARSHCVSEWQQFANFSTGQALFFLRDSNSGTPEVLETQTSNGVVTLDTASLSTTISTFTVSTWRYVAWCVSGTGAGGVQAWTSPVNGGVLVNTSQAGTGIPTAYDTSMIGNDLSSDVFTGRIACLNMWDTGAMTIGDFQDQQFHCRARRTANLDFSLPMYNATNAAKDFGGGNNNVTPGSSAVTTADGPPVVN